MIGSHHSVRDMVLSTLQKTLTSGLSINRDFRNEYNLPFHSIEPRHTVLPVDVPIDDIEYSIIDNFNEIAVSSTAYFAQDKNLFEKLSSTNYSHFCSFWPEDWHSNLRKVGINVLNIDYTLYTMLNSKIHQIDVLQKYGSRFLSDNLNKRHEVLETTFCIPHASSFFSLRERLGCFVVAAPRSAGGSGMFLVDELPDYIEATSSIETPVIRIEKYVDAISLTQLGIVFKNDVFVYPLQEQYIRLNGNRLGYSGASSDLAHIDDTSASTASEVSLAVGRAISKLGYLGAFGCDLIYLPATGDVLFMELNPRFVGETFLFSEFAAAATKYGDLEQRVMLDPHFLHACALLDLSCPSEVSEFMTENSIFSLPSQTSAGYSTFLPLSLQARTTFSREQQRSRSNYRICLLFKKNVASDPVVPTRFRAPVEALWTRIQVEQRSV